MPPQSQPWPGNRAVLFVHGIGNARPGDYSPLVAQVQQILGDSADGIAFYFLYYDQINDWFAEKVRAAQQVAALAGAIRAELATMKPDVANTIADFAGDVLWPVLLADGREAVRTAYLAQLQQMVRDGTKNGTGLRPRELRITIIAHSLGCFHTYEALHTAAADPTLGLTPATWGVRFERVIYMASPVQLIRTVASKIAFAVPRRDTLHCLSQGALCNPSEKDEEGNDVAAVKHVVSITGNLDPVGGWFVRARAPWAYTELPGQQSFIDQQQLATVSLPDDLSLAALLQAALRGDQPPSITPNNPHDWSEYVRRHDTELRQWLA